MLPTSNLSSTCETGSTKSASTQTTALSSPSLPTRLIWSRMMTDRKGMVDLQIKDEKVWIVRIIQIWFRIQKKIMRIVMIEGVRENYSSNNVLSPILMQNIQILKTLQI